MDVPMNWGRLCCGLGLRQRGSYPLSIENSCHYPNRPMWLPHLSVGQHPTYDTLLPTWHPTPVPFLLTRMPRPLSKSSQNPVQGQHPLCPISKGNLLLFWLPPSIIHSLQIKDVFRICICFLPHPQIVGSSRVAAVFIFLTLQTH